MVQKKISTILFCLVFCFLIILPLHAQKQLWNPLSNHQFNNTTAHFTVAELDVDAFLKILKKAKSKVLNHKAPAITLPITGFESQNFELIEAPILSEVLQKKYPHYHSYKIIATNNPLIQGRMTWTDRGLFVHLNEANQTFFIEAFEEQKQSNLYKIYTAPSQINQQALLCGNTSTIAMPAPEITHHQRFIENTHLKTFRIAVTATEQFTNRVGGSSDLALSYIINALSSLNHIYERDLGMRFILHAQNEQLIFTDENPAPFSDINDAFGLWERNTSVLDSIIGNESYDIGHVFTTDCTGGVAGLGALGGVCTSRKGNGVSCLFDENNTEFRKTLYHEIGHQLGANHTWSNCGNGASQNQRHAATAVEPGSGSTIMSYGGLCGPTNIVSAAQDNLHGISILEIQEVLSRDSISCYQEIAVENTAPFIELRADSFFIPILTTFELEADVFDAEDDVLTYSWEQFDTGSISQIGEPIGTAPSFRAYTPSKSPLRTFPRTTDIILNRMSNVEVLPDTSRKLSFGLTVRDNHEGGGSTTFEKITFFSSAKAGPFVLSHPDTIGIEYHAKDSIDIIWDVANTDQAPINCQKIDIYLSFNNGQIFPEILAQGVPNTGFAKVVLPDTTTNRARIKIKCSDNIFFDMSNNRFKIKAPLSTTTLDLPASQIVLYPNPVTTSLSLKFSEIPAKKGNLFIFNALGNKVLSHSLNLHQNIFNLDVSQLQNGIYFLQGQLGAYFFTKRFIIQNE
jgi:hypothetical protein